jgi:hypothetical protein
MWAAFRCDLLSFCSLAAYSYVIAQRLTKSQENQALAASGCGERLPLPPAITP